MAAAATTPILTEHVSDETGDYIVITVGFQESAANTWTEKYVDLPSVSSLLSSMSTGHLKLRVVSNRFIFPGATYLPSISATAATLTKKLYLAGEELTGVPSYSIANKDIIQADIASNTTKAHGTDGWTALAAREVWPDDEDREAVARKLRASEFSANKDKLYYGIIGGDSGTQKDLLAQTVLQLLYGVKVSLGRNGETQFVYHEKMPANWQGR